MEQSRPARGRAAFTSLKQGKAIVIGSVVLDMTDTIQKVPEAFEGLWERGKITVSPGFSPDESVPGALILPMAMPKGEERLAGLRFALSGKRTHGIGGAAYNASVRCLSQLGIEEVRIRCCIGDDPDGDAIFKNLRSIKGMDLSGVSRRRGTAKSWILRVAEGERFIFTLRSQPPEVPDRLFSGDAGLLILCNCGDPATSLAILEKAAMEKSVAVAWIAARNDLSYLTEKGDFPYRFSEREASCLCLTKDEFAAASQGLQKKLLNAFSVTVLTDGGEGGKVWYHEDGGSLASFAYAAAPLPGTLTDTTGAGDAFATTLAVSLYQGLTPQEAVENARQTAARKVCSPGATGDLAIQRVGAMEA